MADFGEVGQRVTITGGTWEGDQGIIIRPYIDSDKEVRIKIDNTDADYKYIDYRNLTKITPTSDKWEFKSIVNIDIEFDLLTPSLTRAHPLLLIERGDTQLVFVHGSLISKMNLLQIDTLPDGDEFEYIPNLFLIKTPFSDWITWAKNIKNAKWPTEYRDPQIVKIHQPTI